MAYEKTEWKPRTGSDLNRFEKGLETSRSVILHNAPNRVDERGTPFSVNNMNHIEQGIFDAHELVREETAARTSADSQLRAGIDGEAQARASADSQLQSGINGEAQARASADSQLQSGINGEAQARAAADSQLRAGIDGEAQARASADSQLRAGIDGEVQARAAADSAMGARITAIENAGNVPDAKPRRFYTVTVGGTQDKFYPVVFRPGNNNGALVQIFSRGANAADPYNCNMAYFYVAAAGHSDTPKRIQMYLNARYDNSEVTIHSVYGASSSSYYIAVYLRGGLTYNINADLTLEPKTSGFADNASVFPVMDGGGNFLTASADIALMWKYTDGDFEGRLNINRFYPVGTIYESAVNTSPAAFIGGTWTVFGAGRVAVCVDTGDSDFNTVEKTGGASAVALAAANMPCHRHSQSAHSHTIPDRGSSGVSALIVSSGNSTCGMLFNAGLPTSSVTPPQLGLTGGNGSAEGNGTAHENKMKYITCYRWKRTA